MGSVYQALAEDKPCSRQLSVGRARYPINVYIAETFTCTGVKPPIEVTRYFQD
jgi:hypothetical protein